MVKTNEMYAYNILFNVGIYFITFTGYVWSAPSLTPSTVDVYSNSMVDPVSVTLTCTYKLRLSGYISWYLDAGEGVFKLEKSVKSGHCQRVGLVIHSKYTYNCTGTQMSWTINNLTWKNDGDRWKCSTSTIRIQEYSNIVLINVRVPVQSVVLTTPIDDTITISEHTDIYFVCQTRSGYPSADITWYKDNGTPATTGDDVAIGTNSSTLSSDMDQIGLSNSTGMLTFYPKRSDNGMRIYCSANNTEKTFILSSRRPLLNVLYTTSVSSFVVEGHSTRTVTVDEHDSPVLICSVDSNPPSTTSIRIQFHGKILKEEETSTHMTHRLSDVSCRDIGVYRCFAGNDPNTQASSMKELILYVKCRPQPYGDIVESVYSVLNSSATLWVDSIAYPSVSDFYWTKDNYSINVELWKNSTTKRLDAYINVTHVELPIANVNESDYGVYKVYVSNSIGTLERTIVLKPEATRDPLRQNGTYSLAGVAVSVVILVGLVVPAAVFMLRKRRATNEAKWDDHTANRSYRKDAKDTTSEVGDEYDEISEGHFEKPNNNGAIYYNDEFQCGHTSKNQLNSDTIYYNEETKVNPYEALSKQGHERAVYTSLEESCEDQNKVDSDNVVDAYEYVKMENN